MRCSELNHHLFDMHIIPSAICQCGDIESTLHYFVQCPKYNVIRRLLVNQLTLLELDLNLETILYGCQNDDINVDIVEAVDEYMTGYGRFSLL